MGDVFTQDWILERLTKLNGNIDLSLKVLNSAMKNLELGYQNLESILEKCIQEQQEYVKKLERISPKTTFYF
ncbi:MAG: hypothetical protein IJ704_04685 [Bacilli bacterium]|nr:hypothetical protein [Bacilli bacterium]